MAQAISTGVIIITLAQREKLNAVITRYQPKAHIKSIVQLSQGLSNDNYLVSTSKQRCLVKFYRQHFPQQAIYTQQQLAKKAVCPAPLYWETHNKVAVFEFIAGQTAEVFSLNKLLAGLVTLHQHPYQGQAVNLKAEIASYQEIEGFSRYQEQLHTALEHLAHYPQELCFCHNDLVKENIISHSQSAKPWQFIDFEYAGVNDRFFDLAMLSCTFSLSEKQQKQLLAAYFAEISTPLTLQEQVLKLKAMMQIVAALNYFWFKKQGAENHAHLALGQLEDRL